MTIIKVARDTTSSISAEEIERLLKDFPWDRQARSVCRDVWMHWALRPEWQMRKPVRPRKSARKMRRKYASRG